MQLQRPARLLVVVVVRSLERHISLVRVTTRRYTLDLLLSMLAVELRRLPPHSSLLQFTPLCSPIPVAQHMEGGTTNCNDLQQLGLLGQWPLVIRAVK